MAHEDLPLEDYRSILDGAVEKFQRQTSVPLWIFTDSAGIKAAAFGVPYRFGPRGRWVDWLFKRTGATGSSLVALWTIGFVVVMSWWARSLFATRVVARGAFIGTGAGSEEQLFEKFEKDLGGRAVRVHHDNPRSWASLSTPSFRSLIGQLSAECARSYNAIKRSDDVAIRGRFSMWMALSAARVGGYVFARAWAAALPSNVERLAFISPDAFCFAAVDSRTSGKRLAIEYWQHGLLYRSIIFPKLDRIYALDRAEGLHMNRLCGSAFQSTDERIGPAGDTKATLFFASVYDTEEFVKSRAIHVLRDLFGWARAQGLSIVIRPHPREDKLFWSTHFPDIQIDRRGDRFAACVERWKPLFVASWFSTSLIDALRLGFAPVLLTEGSAPFLRDMVLPLEQIALNWPASRAEMESLARDRAELRLWVAKRGEEVFSSSPSQ